MPHQNRSPHAEYSDASHKSIPGSLFTNIRELNGNHTSLPKVKTGLAVTTHDKDNGLGSHLRYHDFIKQKRDLLEAAQQVPIGSSIPASSRTLSPGMSTQTRAIECYKGTDEAVIPPAKGGTTPLTFTLPLTSHSYTLPSTTAATIRKSESHNPIIQNHQAEGSMKRSSQILGLTPPHHNPPMARPGLVIKQSRLPVNTVGRKAPRKSAYEPTTPASSLKTTLGARTVSTPTRVRKPTKNLREAFPPAPPLGRKKPLNNTSRATQDASAVASPTGPKLDTAYLNVELPPSDREATSDKEDKSSSPAASTTSNGSKENSLEPVMVTRGNNLAQQQRREYDIPPELRGVARALGRDYWTDYVKLAERYVKKRISENEFDVGGRRIFHVLDDRMRGRLRRSVVQMVGLGVGRGVRVSCGGMQEGGREVRVDMER